MKKLIGSVALVGAMSVGITGITMQPGMAAVATDGVARSTPWVAPRIPVQVHELGAQVAAPQQAAGPAAHAGRVGSMGGRVGLALPWVVGYAIWLIARFGIPWLVRFSYGAFTSVFFSQSRKLLVCQQLRRMNNGWGWSSYCKGT